MSYIAIYICCGSCYLHSQESSIQLFHWIYSVDPFLDVSKSQKNSTMHEVWKTEIWQGSRLMRAVLRWIMKIVINCLFSVVSNCLFSVSQNIFTRCNLGYIKKTKSSNMHEVRKNRNLSRFQVNKVSFEVNNEGYQNCSKTHL